MELNDIVKLQINNQDVANISAGHYGTCETAGGTAAKTASVDGLILGMNTQVSVLFNNGFTISNPTLSINGGTAHAMKIGGSALPPHLIAAKSIVTMIYDGTDFNVISIEKIPQPQTMGYVDLGLSTGLKWATMNVGATKPEEQGYFFSWGNVEGHCLNGVTDYDFGTSTTGAPYSGSAGAALSGDIAVGDTYDMARANLGGAWRLPTKAEFQTLYDETTCTWETQNGVTGRLFVSKASGNSNSVFFPAAGYYNGSSHNYVGSNGYYWSSSFVSATDAYHLYFYSTDVYPQDRSRRYYGFSVRAVQ